MSMSGTILVVEDEAATRFFLSQALSDVGYDVLEADCAAGALGLVSERNVDLAILDLRLPDRSGLEILPELLDHDPDLPVIFLTGHGSVQEAVQAMKLRACDFIAKPPDLPTLKRTIAHLLRNVQLQRDVQRLRANPPDSAQPLVIGKTRRMARVLEMAERVAPTTASILITGESGTGKERIANLIHEKSNRSSKPMVAVNCSAIPKHLLESELFGSVKGAYTGAITRKGLIEQANGGTLFLDEISAMSLDMQAKLLRVIEDRMVRRVGATTEMEVDLRLVTASNRNLKAMIEAETFREDLYYRIAVFTIELPPLRQRMEDIPLIAAAYIDHFSRKANCNVEGLTPEALACLEAYHWPGNIRELRNIIERAVILADGPQIGIEHLPSEITRLSLKATGDGPTGKPSAPLAGSLLDVEKRLIADAMERSGGDLDAAAELLGITPAELRRRLASGSARGFCSHDSPPRPCDRRPPGAAPFPPLQPRGKVARLFGRCRRRQRPGQRPAGQHILRHHPHRLRARRRNWPATGQPGPQKPALHSHHSHDSF